MQWICVYVRSNNVERRERNSRDMDFTCLHMRGLDHISGQDSRPKKKWDLYAFSSIAFHVFDGILSAQFVFERNALLLHNALKVVSSMRLATAVYEPVFVIN
jgi:hypothetical protein